jgi:hypothetical protein
MDVLATAPSMYDRIGGAVAVRSVIDPRELAGRAR